MPNNKQLHLVSFNIPYPPNYGGIIDVFYKIKALHQLNIEVYLHCFEYDRPQQKELEKYCKKVHYYQRASKVTSLFSSIPYIVKNRESHRLISQLKKIEAPILFEGLHTSYPLTITTFKAKVFIRTHNIEHHYFKGLASSETNIFKKLFYHLEALKLKKYESIINKADGVLSISPFEQAYFSSKYEKKCTYIPAFHQAQFSSNHTAKGAFVLYHGDLRISDNIKAASFLIDTYKDSPYPLVLASSHAPSSICNRIALYKNIHFETITSQEDLRSLFKEAHINTLLTFQKTGIKLKLLHALYQGKFIIANRHMIADTGLESLCELANTKEEILEKTASLFSKEFSNTCISNRKEELTSFSPSQSAKKIEALIFN